MSDELQQALMRRADGLVVAIGAWPAGTDDPAVEILDLTDKQYTALLVPGTEKLLAADGTITTRAVDLSLPPPPPAQTVAQVAALQKAQARIADSPDLAPAVKAALGGALSDILAGLGVGGAG